MINIKSLCLILLIAVASFASAEALQKAKSKQKVAVMIHGAGGGGWEYDFWKPVFEKQGWKVITPDLMPTSKGIATTTFPDYVKQIVKVCQPYKNSHLVLIGASMGGILALKAAEEVQPKAIVLVNSVTPAGIGDKTPKQYPEVIEWSKGTLQETRDSMPDSDEVTIQKAFKRWRDESGKVLNEISAGIAVKSPRQPVLVVLGENDTDIPPALGTEMAKRYKADMIHYAGMSHVGPLLSVRAKEVALQTLTWLEAR